MSYYDSELDKMRFALKSSQKNINGFEGCKNYRENKGCNFAGFYLCTYSKEGLCTKCELNEFPERFHGCLFCRSPLCSVLDICLDCNSSFREWCTKYIKYTHPVDLGWKLREYLEQGIFRLTQRVTLLTNCKEKNNFPFINGENNNGLNEKWKGFYMGLQGNHKWIIPTIDIIISDQLTWENVDKILLKALEQNGIYIYDEIQIKNNNDKHNNDNQNKNKLLLEIEIEI